MKLLAPEKNMHFCYVHCLNNPKIIRTMFEQYLDRLIGRLIVRTTPLEGTCQAHDCTSVVCTPSSGCMLHAAATLSPSANAFAVP
jgi:hypothetical protein